MVKSETNLPDFLVIGAAKSGTTSLYHYLKQHPEIFLPKIKEINFFAYDPINPGKRKYWAKTIDEYKKFYKGSSGFKSRGEVSPSYMNSSVAPQKIYSFIPDAKIIAVLRNPVDRAFSRYMMSLRMGKKMKSFEEVINDKNTLVIQEGNYYDRLIPYYEIFPRGRIKIFIFEKMQNNMNGFFKELFTFLGVDSSFQPDTSVRYAEKFILRNKLLSKLIYSDIIRFGVKPFLPGSFIKRVKGAVSKNSDHEGIPVNTKKLLNHYYSQNIAKLEGLIETDLSEWKLDYREFSDYEIS
jgi:hypothetical protein